MKRADQKQGALRASMECIAEARRAPTPKNREGGREIAGEAEATAGAAGDAISAASTHHHPASRTSRPGGGNQNDNDDQFPSHIRQRENAWTEEDAAGAREEGYDGDRVRLLVGSFNVGNSPLNDLAPWLPYGGKGYDLIVVGLQESTYRPPRGGRDSPHQRTSSLSPSNSFSPPRGISPRWAAMQAGEMDDTPPPGVYLSPVPYPATPAQGTPQTGVDSRRESTGSAVGLGARSDRGTGYSRGRWGSSPDFDGSLMSPPQGNLTGPPPRTGGEGGNGVVAGDENPESGERSGDRGSDGERRQSSVVLTGGVDGAGEGAAAGKKNVAAESLQDIARKGTNALDESTSGSILGGRRLSVPWESLETESRASEDGGASADGGAARLSEVDARDDSGGREGQKASLCNPFSHRIPRSPNFQGAGAGRGGRAPPTQGGMTTMGPSALPRETSNYMRKKTEPVYEHLVATSPFLGKDHPKRATLWRDSSIGKESGSTSTTGGKDMSRLDRARKVLKKRRKEMDAGAMHLRSKLSGHLGPDFEQVISLRRMQMRVKVFLRRSLLDVYHRSEGESASENTGIARLVANKGGLVCKLRLKGTTLCFVSCHLQAHEGQNHLVRRNASCAEILQGARLGDRRMIDVDSQFHHVFWFGDMNYRISFGLSPEKQHNDVIKLVKEKNWSGLWEGDELMRELKDKRVLTGFQTEPPAFAPTFKTLRGQEEGYSTKRVPSYTDRILWKSLPGHAPNLELLKFVSFPKITSSDHKPIHAAFSVKLTPEVLAPAPEKKRRGFRRARIPAVLEAPRKGQPSPLRLVFEDLHASGLPPVTGGGLRNPFVVISSDPKHLIKSNGGKAIKTEHKKKTLNPRWNRKCTCQLALSDPSLLNHSHVSLLVMNRERGSKDEVIGVANLSLADVGWLESLRPTTNANSVSPRSAFAATRRRSMPSLRRSSSSPPYSREIQSPPPAGRENSAIFAGIDYDIVDDFDDEEDDDDVTDDGYDDDDDEDDVIDDGEGVGGGVGVPAGEAAAVMPGADPLRDSGTIEQQRQKLSSDGELLPPHLPPLRPRHQQHVQRVQRRGRTLPRHRSDGWLMQRIFSRNSFRGNDLVFPATATATSGRRLSETARHAFDGHHVGSGAGREHEDSCLPPVEGKAGIGDGGRGASSARRNHQNASPFFHSLESRMAARGGEAEQGEKEEEQEDTMTFDLMLVGNGLPRGRISGRCYLVMGSGVSVGGGSLRLGSVGFYGVGSGGVDGGTGGDGKTNGHGGVEGSGDGSDRRLVSSSRGKKSGLRRLLPGLRRARNGHRNGSGNGGSRAVASGATEREYQSAAARDGDRGKGVAIVVAQGKAPRTSSLDGSSASSRPASAAAAAAAAATTAAAAAATAAVAAQSVRGAGHPAGCSLM